MYNFIALGGGLCARFPASWAFDPFIYLEEETIPIIPGETVPSILRGKIHFVITKRSKMGTARKWRPTRY